MEVQKEAEPQLDAVINPSPEPPEEVYRLKPGVPYRLAVCGQPIPRTEYYQKLVGLNNWRLEHAANVRSTMDRVYKYASDNVDMMMVSATHPLTPDFIKAECAFNALAWYTFFDPFAHPKRKHVFKSGFLMPYIESHADSLYKYGVYVKQLPSEEIYGKLKDKHVDTARQYFEYCAHVTVARMEGADLSWITQW